MKTDMKYFNYLMCPLVAVSMAYGFLSVVNKNTESSDKDLQRKDKNKIEAFLKADSLAKKAYFEGIQMVKDSLIKKEEK